MYEGGAMEMFENKECKECIAIGEYISDDSTQVIKLLGCNRINEFKIKKSGICYSVEVKQMFNRKIVKIIADRTTYLHNIYMLLMDVLRFENLYDGIFFMFTSFKVDGEESIEKYKHLFLNYMHSKKQYCMLPINYDDKTYKTMFLRWQKVIKKSFFRHQAFLNSLFVNDLTVDVRMALILEIFESIANEKAEEGIIALKAQPYIIYKNKCKKCGTEVCKKVQNKKVYLYDKLYAVVKEYGKDIFYGESKAKIARKGTNLRNKIDHISKQKNIMQGEQAGFYLHKFGLMYRIIILKEIDAYNDDIQKIVKLWVDNMNKNYAKCRILP